MTVADLIKALQVMDQSLPVCSSYESVLEIKSVSVRRATLPGGPSNSYDDYILTRDGELSIVVIA